MNDWQKGLIELLQDYTDSVTEGVKDAVREVAEETEAAIREASPVKKYGKKKGRYKKGWIAEQRLSSTAVRSLYSIHNKTDYQLTHLLEFGHINRDGSFTQPRPHIRAASDAAHEKLMNKVEDVIKKG